MDSSAQLTKRHGACSFCGTLAFKIKYDFGSHRIVKCEKCGLMRLSPMPTTEDTKQVYADISYFQNPEFFEVSKGNLYGYVDYIAERVNKFRGYRPIAEYLYKQHGNQAPDRSSYQPMRLLDVGCGLGYFLDVAQDVGFNVVGVEFNPGAVKAMQQKYAFKVYEGSVGAVPLSEGPLDVVTMFDVIEHLHDPFGDLQRINQLLRMGGGLAVATMDCESITSRLLGKRLEDFRRIREHLYFFSRPAITRVLEEYGFSVTCIKSHGHTFELAFLLERMSIISRPIFRTIRWFVQRAGLGRLPVSVDPRTKMIVYAKKIREIDDANRANI